MHAFRSLALLTAFYNFIYTAIHKYFINFVVTAVMIQVIVAAMGSYIHIFWMIYFLFITITQKSYCCKFTLQPGSILELFYQF